MIKASSNDTDQLTTSVNRPRVWPLVIAPVPLLCASFHLSHIVGSQRQMLQMTTSGHGTRRDEVVQQQGIEGTEHTPRTLNSLIDCLSQRIGHIRIITSSLGFLDVVPRLEMLEALRASIVDILGVGDELRRRRSIRGRHFIWRTG